MLFAHNGGWFIRAVEELLCSQDWISDEKKPQFLRFISPTNVGGEGELQISHSSSFEYYSSCNYTVIYKHRLEFHLYFESKDSKNWTQYILDIGSSNDFTLTDAAGLTRIFLQQDKDSKNYKSIAYLWDPENH